MDEARATRLRLLRRALSPFGVSVDSSALGPALRLSMDNGNAIVTAEIEAIWPWLEGALGRPWDPLTPAM